MVMVYLHAWNNGPGHYERSGNVKSVVREMTISASHVHASQGFPFNKIRFWEA